MGDLIRMDPKILGLPLEGRALELAAAQAIEFLISWHEKQFGPLGPDDWLTYLRPARMTAVILPFPGNAGRSI